MSVIPNYVRCSVRGDDCMRFVNLCRSNGIELKHLSSDEEGLKMDIRAEAFKRLRPLIRKTHVRIHILNRRGPAFFFYRHTLRLWFILGLLACAAVIGCLSLYVWQIDITGNQKYTDALLLQSLRTLGVETGCRKSALSLPSIEEELRMMHHQITWVSASVTGTRLLIEIREGNLQTEDAADHDGMNGHETDEADVIEDQPADLTASVDAVITSLVVRRGTAAVRLGDEVRAGDVLVEGKVYLYNDDETLKKVDYLQADADILGNYEVYYDKSYGRTYTKRIYTEDTHTACTLQIGTKQLALPDFYTIPENCERWSWQKRFRLTPTFYLPVSLYLTAYVPYTAAEASYTDEQLREMAGEDLANYLDELEKKGVQIIGNSVTISLDADGGHAAGVLSLNGPVYQKTPIDSSRMARTGQTRMMMEDFAAE